MASAAGTTDTETLSKEGSSSVLELSDGRILRLTDGLEASVSHDEGTTWQSTPVCDDRGRPVIGGRNFSLCRMKSGALAILYNREEQLPGRPTNYGSYFRRSTNDGETWSAESRVDFVEGVAWAWHDTMTVTPSGRIVIPFRAINPSTYVKPTIAAGIRKRGRQTRCGRRARSLARDGYRVCRLLRR
jgi:hypothetical protein